MHNATLTNDLSQHTPMMQQYLQIKQAYADCLVFYRMGDFYELFYNDAVLAAKVLGITLTQRGKSAGEPIAMCGVPYHAADAYIARLIKAGHRIAVCEQIGEASKKGPMQRAVVRILSAGTITDDALLTDALQQNIVALCVGKHSRLGIAALDLSTGRFACFEIDDSPQLLASELARLAPVELLISERSDLALYQTMVDCQVLRRPFVDFDPSNASSTLCQQFAVSTLAGFGIESLPYAQAAAAALLHYARDTQKTDLLHIQRIIHEQPGDFVTLDATTRKNLEIIYPLFAHGTSLFDLLNKCQTSMGSRLLAQMLMQPCKDQAVLQQRLDAIGYIQAHALERPLQSQFAAISDLERIISRVALGSAKPRDLVHTQHSCANAASLATLLASASGEQPTLIANVVLTLQQAVYPQLASYLATALVADPPMLVRDGGVIKEGFDTQLDELRHLRTHAGDVILALEAAERERTGLSTLKIAYNRVSGYYIALSKVQSEKAPAHFIRRQTLKNEERYTTPELKDFEDKILSSEARALAREKHLYEALIGHIQAYIAPLQQLASSVATIDVLQSISSIAHQYQWVRPTYQASSGVNIRAGRHPVVESLINTPYTANDTELNADHKLVIITGPNMGGKSTYMRQSAIICLLAYCGFYVPAASACIGPLDRIFTRIGSADDLSSGKSTFMVEMVETAQILNHATAQSLVLMDEVGRGTSTYDGLALAHACILELCGRIGALTLFATHYFELTSLAHLPYVSNMHVNAQEIDGQLVLLHQVRTGPASKSFGLQVAKLAGIPLHVIAAAHSKLSELETLSQPRQAVTGDLFAQYTQAPVVSEASVHALYAPLMAMLAEVDADNITPRQALDVLVALQAKRPKV